MEHRSGSKTESWRGVEDHLRRADERSARKGAARCLRQPATQVRRQPDQAVTALRRLKDQLEARDGGEGRA